MGTVVKNKSFKKPFVRKLSFFLLILLGLFVVGVSGYMLIEKWRFIDAIYMTVITVSTVGFKEALDLSEAGKIFTIFLIILSFISVAMIFSMLTNSILGGEYKQYLKFLRMERKINAMHNHTIICGFGRVGKQVVEDLSAKGKSLIVLDIQFTEQHTNEFQNSGILFIEGDATDEKTFENLRMDEAESVISCLPKDADNVYVTLITREISKKIKIISRASHQQAVSKLKSAGANHVIIPDAIGGSHMASLITNPDVIEFMDLIRLEGSEGNNIEAIDFENLPANFHYAKLGEIDVKSKTGVTIIGFKSASGEYIINPDSDLEIKPNSTLFVLGNSSQIKRMNDLCQISEG